MSFACSYVLFKKALENYTIEQGIATFGNIRYKSHGVFKLIAMNIKNNDNLISLLKEKSDQMLISVEESLGDVVVTTKCSDILEFCTLLKQESELAFNFLVDITAVDWVDEKEDRFEVVSHFLSHEHNHRVRVKVSVSEDNASLPSICSLWSSANFLEREVWDMYGISFEQHPDLRRILMYDEFEGHPLRKDYPVQGKQPRVPMLHPEVENTAIDMKRAALVQINKKRTGDRPRLGDK